MKKPMRTVSVTELQNQLDDGAARLIDVRTPVEYRQVHATGASNVPLDQLDPAKIKVEQADRSTPLYVICGSGNRSSNAVQKLTEAGVDNVVDVEGGTKAWTDAGFSVVRGQKGISLERQVRIAAGSIALVGSVAAMVTGNVFFAAIPAFIGAGLTFAGITDTCGMGMMLAKMPWNQCESQTGCSM